MPRIASEAMLTTISAIHTAAAAFDLPMKLTFGLVRKLRLRAVVNVMFAQRPFLVIRSNAMRVRNTAVKNEQTIPIIKVVAKPLMGPEPK